jgi:transglutaminase-like putative cysteine protease
MATRELPVSVALAALSASIALSFGAVFTSAAFLGPLLVAAVAPHALGWVTRRVTPSVAVQTLASLFGVVVLAAVVAGSLSEVTRQVSAGWTVVMNDRVPLPASTGAVLLAAVIVFVVGAVMDDLAFHEDGTTSPLAIALVTFLWVRGFGLLAEATPWSLTRGWVFSTIAFGVTAVAFLALQHRRLLEQRRTRVGRRPRVLGLRVIVGVVVSAVAITVAGALVSQATGVAKKPVFATPGAFGSGVPLNYTTTIGPLVSVGSQLQQGPRRTVFTVRAAQPAYWRLTALDHYSGAGGGAWTLNASGRGVSTGLSGPAPHGALRQQFHIGPLGERWMPAAFDPVAVSRSNTLVVHDSGTLVTGDSTVSGLTYTVESQLPVSTVTEAQRQASAGPVPASLQADLALPRDVPAVVLQTAKQVTAGRTLPYDQAAALRDFFHTAFVYDPTVNLSDDEHAMVDFLSIRRGFCVQFASTFAVMARSLGIPARVATGFTPGTSDGHGDYVVTNLDAHAWPEIWLNGLGWTNAFDPTPSTPLPGGGAPPTVAPTLNQTPVSVPPTIATTPAPSTSGSGSASGQGGATPPPPRAPSRVSVTTAHSPGLSLLSWVLIVLGLVAAGTLATLAVVETRKRRRRARRRERSEPAEQVAGAWTEVLDHLRAAGLVWPASLTPRELAARVPARLDASLAPPFSSLAARYTAVRYRGDQPPPAEVDAAWADADAVLRALAGTLDLRAQLRARTHLGGSERQPEPAGWSARSRSTND